MRRHSEFRDQIYDYVRGDLPAAERPAVEEHLASCESCSSEAAELGDLLRSAVPTSARPSDERPPEFWQNFYTSVERRIDVRETPAPATSLWDDVIDFVIGRKRLAIGFSTLVLLLVSVITLWRQGTPPPDAGRGDPPPASPGEFTEVNQRMGEYLSKSKTLLVGITNMDLDNHRTADFSSEQKVSRALIEEARSLRRQPMDLRSARLVGDLEKILIELANMKKENDRTSIEMIRSGIHRGNLLFKVRMAESIYESPRFVNVNQGSQGDER